MRLTKTYYCAASALGEGAAKWVALANGVGASVTLDELLAALPDAVREATVDALTQAAGNRAVKERSFSVKSSDDGLVHFEATAEVA